MTLTTLKLLRMQRDLLQIELAQRTNIPRCRLTEIENAHVQASPDELRRLAAALNVSVDALRHAVPMLVGDEEHTFAQSVAGNKARQRT